jgi:hypothetical protein
MLEYYRRFGDAVLAIDMIMMMKVASACETSVNLYRATRRNIQEHTVIGV